MTLAPFKIFTVGFIPDLISESNNRDFGLMVGPATGWQLL
jgi:hypothetical protein